MKYFIILVFNLSVKLHIASFIKDDNHHVFVTKKQMKKLRKYSLFIFLFSVIFSCKTPQVMLSQGVSQGLTGTVLWYEGDLMPGIDKDPVEGKPVAREILIYELTSLKQAKVRDDYFYYDLETRLVKTVLSDKEGKFVVELEPGIYSVFVKEERGLFAKRFIQGGHINPVEIHSNELVTIRIRVDYEAAY